jgi:plasmid stabilization system protein ParE
VNVRILESARADLVDAFYFYEKQADGIGIYFLDSIYPDIDSLIHNAGIHPVFFGEYHRLLAARFPFAVYYKVLQDTALVFAVLDCRREPAWTRTRLPPPTSREDPR